MKRLKIANFFSASMRLKHCATANCFAAYVRPHLLFVHDFSGRERVVMACGLAWNIGSVPDAARREQQIDRMWQMLDANNRALPTLEMAQEFTRNLRKLIAHKRNLFPWSTTVIQMAQLAQKQGRDVLCVKTQACVEDVALDIEPDTADWPTFAEHVRRVHDDTAIQAELICQMKLSDAMFNDVDTTHIVAAYCVLRADVATYRETLAQGQQMQKLRVDKDAIRDCLAMLSEIEEDSTVALSALIDRSRVSPFA